MRRYLEDVDFISEVILSVKPTVLVEGLTDVKLIKKLFDSSNTDLIKVLSPRLRGLNRKGLILQVIENLPKPKQKNVIGIIDSDYNKILGKQLSYPNLFYTDSHDIEMQIIASNAFKDVITNNYRNPENINISKIREICVDLAKELGYYILSCIGCDIYNLREKIPPIEIFIDQSLQFIHKRLEDNLELLKNRGEFTEIQYQKIISGFIQWKDKEASIDPYHLANGHDLVKVLIIISLWKLIGLEHNEINEIKTKSLLSNFEERDELAKIFEYKMRKAYNFNYFQNSDLYSKIIQYQNHIGKKFIN